MAHLTFFTRKGCHLCDVALEALEPFRARYDFSFEIIDLDHQASAEKLTKYTDQVPVIELDGRKIMKYRVEPERLQRLLDLA